MFAYLLASSINAQVACTSNLDKGWSNLPKKNYTGVDCEKYNAKKNSKYDKKTNTYTVNKNTKTK